MITTICVAGSSTADAKEAQLSEFWTAVDEITEEVLSMTEEELIEAFGEETDTPRSLVVDEYSSTYQLNP
ncbi:MAG: hypothetical protein LBG05_10200, partial [Treponema sp.]|nr:hypothetical protein [Treponema sp.]